MPLDAKALSRDVAAAIICNKGWEDKGLAAHDLLAQLSPDEAFEAYCEWHGIIGWASRLTSVLENIKEAAR